MIRTALAVLGAGPAGVGAASFAARRGHDVVVLERNDRVGGAATSIEVAGMPVDLGSHRLHRATDPDVLAHLTGLLGDDLQVRPRRGRIRLAGRWLPFPLSPRSLASLPPGFALRAAWDTATAPVRRPRADTFAESIRAGLGPTMLERFYGPYAAKLWGLDPGEIDAEQARVRVAAANPAALLRRIVRGADPDARTFRYPRRGFGQISRALAGDATTHGADIRLRADVTDAIVRPDGVELRTADGGTVHARTVWSTVPLPALARIVHGAPPTVTAAAERLRTRAMLLVYVVLPVPRLTAFDAHYLPEAWTPLTRLSEPKNYRDGHPGPDDPGDPEDRTVLCAEIPCTRGDALWSADERELRDLVRTVLVTAGFPTPPITDTHVVRLPSAYPVYDRGFGRHVATLESWVGGLPGVLTFGRQGLFVHDNTHHTLAMARAAVAALRGDGTLDHGAWSRARERFRAHVVED